MLNRDLDGITPALNRYLAKLDEEDAREDAIEARTEELLAGEYNPMCFSGIAEALGETTGSIRDAIELAARANDLQALIEAVKAASEAYWQQLARSKAEDEINTEWNSCRCHGRGCRRCWEPDEYSRSEE